MEHDANYPTLQEAETALQQIEDQRTRAMQNNTKKGQQGQQAGQREAESLLVATQHWIGITDKIDELFLDVHQHGYRSKTVKLLVQGVLSIISGKDDSRVMTKRGKDAVAVEHKPDALLAGIWHRHVAQIVGPLDAMLADGREEAFLTLNSTQGFFCFRAWLDDGQFRLAASARLDTFSLDAARALLHVARRSLSIVNASSSVSPSEKSDANENQDSAGGKPAKPADDSSRPDKSPANSKKTESMPKKEHKRGKQSTNRDLAALLSEPVDEIEVFGARIARYLVSVM
jgi:hypothetical protein